MRRTRALALAVVAAAAASLAACSGPAPEVDSSLPDTVPVPSGVDLGDDEDPTDVTLDGSADAEPDPTGAVDPTLGTCSVDVSGDVTDSWDGSGGSGSVQLDWWLSAEERDEIEADFVFFLACAGDEGSLTFLAGPNGSRQTLRFGAATYRLPVADGPGGGAGSTSPLAVVLRLAGDRATWGLSQEGVLGVTRLDQSHLSATVDLTFTDVAAGLTSVPPRTVRVTATFEFDRPA